MLGVSGMLVVTTLVWYVFLPARLPAAGIAAAGAGVQVTPVG
jgi:hypothetical protein